ncbi:MAG: SDR family NAD(P)-dependent oxidoreductase [Promethearchaeota archaeon]
MIKEFEGKVAVITGGASGIGLGLANAFARRGMKLVIADIDKETLVKVSKYFTDKKVEVLPVIVDVSDPEQVAHLAEISYKHFGHVNVLCNNAGIGIGGETRFLTKEVWDRILGINLYGVIYGIHFFFNRMLSSREPCHIINTSSLAGLVTGDTAAYSTSKSAVVALSERLELECYNTNVGISVLCPAHVRSNIIETSEKLSRTQAEQPEPARENSYSPEFENAKKLLELGMDPDVMAELVIKAIEEDIFYIFTHPEYLPSLKGRFERIYEDTLKLYNGVLEPQHLETKTFQNDLPRFTVTYPSNFINLNPVNPLSKAIFYASIADKTLEISVSKVSPKRRLEDLTKRIMRNLNYYAKEINIFSENPSKLKDSTPAYETTMEYKILGIFKVRSVYLSVIKDEKWVCVMVSSEANNFDESLKEILYSLEFT